MTNYWKEAIFKNIPHGHEGQIDLNWDEAVIWAKILNKYGYAVLFTDGDMDDNVKVSWLYAGAAETLDYANYDNVVFTNMDYFDDYVDAYNEEYGNAHKEENTNNPDYVAIRPEVSE